MSTIKIQPNSSGSGTFSLASPGSNTSRTLTLPDSTGVLLNDLSSLASNKLTGALPAIDGSALTGVGASTDYGAVGTYVHGFMTTTGIVENSTHAGSGIQPTAWMWYSTGTADDTMAPSFQLVKGGNTLSGTWRAMGRANAYSTGSYMRQVLFVRIS